MAKRKATDSKEELSRLVERDLTALARAGRLPQAYGVDAQVTELLALILRGDKHPLLAGESGVGKTALVQEAARRIVDKKADPALEGTLVVVEPDGASRAVGIVTDRDVAIRCVGGGLDPASTPVSAIMTAQVHSVDEETSIEDALARMAKAGTRRLVVTGRRGEMVGILSLDDVLGLLTQETASIGRLLEKQEPHIPG